MLKQLLLSLLCAVTILMMAESYAEKNIPFQNSNNQIVLPFDEDPFFQSNDDVLNQLNKMHQAMEQFMHNHLLQIPNSRLNTGNIKGIGGSKDIQIEERNNELIYKIKQPQGTDSKVNVSLKDGLLIINTHVMRKTKHDEGNNKSIIYSQSNYSQSLKLPSGYDPNSMDIKTKDSHLIVSFKKQIL